MVSSTVSTNMDENPISSKVLRPESSTRNREINVISTFREPMPSVAYLAPSVFIPAIWKIFVEKNMTCGQTAGVNNNIRTFSPGTNGSLVDDLRRWYRTTAGTTWSSRISLTEFSTSDSTASPGESREEWPSSLRFLLSSRPSRRALQAFLSAIAILYRVYKVRHIDNVQKYITTPLWIYDIVRNEKRKIRVRIFVIIRLRLSETLSMDTACK